ncbi:alcohol dehydrogenase catalytic domain-containing protein [Egicoccus halophilus]|uniref:Putative alcohol dehydrogenase, zinc-containing n=1 Tax=Egicoccus halophilus TaxID=1670830 RepID=A0A8J3AEE8_9ACTN|nr:alcohol dehydrogenase catalytic domain-containing protein [Egicoccus halophilus]GGI06935.1 putative alcohol dehydrogenase, zinc-containing [Egicoccus halophilus]
MRTRAAVLVATDREPPYARSRPLEIVELDLAPPGAGELLVRVEAAGLCHSDLSVVDGNRPRPTPMVLGHEAAGEVVEVGAGVTDVEVGDHVVLVFVPRCGTCAECAAGRPALCERAAAANTSGELLRGGRRWGTLGGQEVHHHLGVSAFAEHVVVDRGSVVVVPDEVPFATAALFGCALLTGAGAVLSSAQVRPGESVAVFGLGGVGLAAVLGAVVAGAHPIIAVDPLEAKRELALELGATSAIGVEDVVDTVRELVPGGVRHAFEAVGSARVLGDAWAVTRRGGTTVAIGLPHPSQELTIPAVQLVGEARTLTGSYLGGSVPQRDIPALIELWRGGRLPVERMHSSSLALEDLNAALDELAAGRTVRQVVHPGGVPV